MTVLATATIVPTRQHFATSDLDALPLAGEVCLQYIRCGKAGCRCERGDLHGPYYYRVWRDGRQVHKVYVKRTEIADVQAGCTAYRQMTQSLRSARLERERLTQSIRREWRETTRLLKSGRAAS